MNKNRILFLCPYPLDIAAGQRFKFENCIEYLKISGYEVIFNSFYTYDDYYEIYKKRNYLKKIKIIFCSYIKRFFFILKAENYKLAYIFLWVVPFGGSFFEKLFFHKKIRTIYDMEDDLLIVQKNEFNKLSYFFKNPNKYRYLIENSDLIIVSTLELEKKYAKIYSNKKIKYIQPTIDNRKYFKRNLANKNKILTIGWTGTFSSKRYLEILVKPLQEVFKIHKFKFIVIGNFEFEIDQIDYEVIFWNKNQEVQQLHQIDIGLYPVSNEPWAEGKSGLKALQYMSNGIPFIASNTEVNKRVVDHLVDGILVDNDVKSWANAILKLINEKGLKEKLAINARKKIIDNYSPDITSRIYLEIFKEVIGN